MPTLYLPGAPPKLYQIRVTVIDWHDGDTFHGVSDHGCYMYLGRESKPIRFRCSHIDAPEMSVPGGPAARDCAAQLAPPGDYPCWSTGLDEYGRPLLDLILPDGRLFSAAMIAAGMAVRYV